VSTTRQPPRRSVLWRIAFALLPLLVLVAVAEATARLFPHRDRGETLSGFVEPDPDLLWRLAPAASGPLATNELGLRDTPYRPDAELQVLLLGDSVAWGDGIVDVRDTFPYLLERRLEALGVPTVEVVNASVPGYSTFQQAIWLERHGLALEPDAVVLQFCLNDVVERYHTVAAYGGDDRFLGVDTRAARADGLTGLLLRHSRAWGRIVRWRQWWGRSREAYAVERLATDEQGADLERAWSRVFDELDRIRRTAEADGIPFLLFVAPYRFQLFGPERTRQPQDRLIAWAERHGVSWVDPLPALAQASVQTPVFDDHSHFSAAGHRLVADLLAAALAGVGRDATPSPGPSGSSWR
jgi:lysophospholipase L1-like esterase